MGSCKIYFLMVGDRIIIKNGFFIIIFVLKFEEVIVDIKGGFFGCSFCYMG